MKVSIFSVALVALVAGFTGNARAQCGSPLAQRGSLLASTWNRPPAVVGAASPEAVSNTLDARPADQPDISIVGLWDVTFTSGGQLYDEAFDAYHSDGTEIMNDTPPPALGNVCLGVWAKTGGRSIRLKHLFWIFDNSGNLIGRGVINEQITLNPDGNSYGGKFNFQFRDLLGNPIASMPDVAGDLAGKRITVD